GRGAAEGLRSRGHFIKNGAERKEIGALIERVAARLFGGHVSDGAHGSPGIGERLIADKTTLAGRARRRSIRRDQQGSGKLGEPEIENLGLSRTRDKDIGGLDVTVGDAAGVSVVERVGDLNGDVQETIAVKRLAG